MAVITFLEELQALRMTWGLKRNIVASKSSFGSQAVEVAAPQWQVTIEANDSNDEVAGKWQALFMRLKGPVNQLEVWNLMRPAPLGTARSTITASSITKNATSCTISNNAANANKTLLRGDYLGFGTGTTQQVVMITQDVTLNASGGGTINFEPPSRNAFGSTSLVWDKPKALFRNSDTEMSWNYSTNIVSGLSQQFVEDWRA